MADPTAVPFVDLSRQFRALEKELTEAFLEVGRSGIYIMGERLESFEKKMAAYLGVRHVLGVADGSSALFLIFKSLGIGAGDEVITAPNSFIATAWTIAATGAKPVFVDVLEDMNIDPDQIEKKITSRTKAIVPVHLAGRPAAMDAILKIAERHRVAVVEDAAQAIGASYRGKKVGGFGKAAGFSLHPLKNLGVYGDGGMITTNDDGLAATLRKLRNHGLINRDECEFWGFNSRLDPLQAAFAEIKLTKLDHWNERCREIAGIYRKGITQAVKHPVDQADEICVYHNYVLQTEKRDALREYLKQHGVDTRIHYPIPIHLQKAAKDLGLKEGDFPVTERLAKTMVSLPIFPELTDPEVTQVVESVNRFFN